MFDLNLRISGPGIHFLFYYFQINGDTKIEIPNEELDRRYYEEKIATDLDRWLEDPVTGNLRMWHLIMMISGVVSIASKNYH